MECSARILRLVTNKFSMGPMFWPRWGLILGFLWTVTGCGGTKQIVTKEMSLSTRPTWISSLPRQPDYAFFVGVASRAPSLEEGKAKANAQVSNSAAQFVQTKVQSEFLSLSSTEPMSDRVEETIRSAAQALVKDLEVMEEYYEKTSRVAGNLYEASFDVWVLGRFPLAAAEAERERLLAEAKANAGRAMGLLKEAIRDEKQRRLASAHKSLFDAIRILERVPDSIDVVDPEYSKAGDVRLAISRRLDALDARSRSVSLTVEGRRIRDTQLAMVRTVVTSALGQAGIRVLRPAESRFWITVQVRSEAGGRALGHQTARAIYDFTIDDAWSKSRVGADSGRAKGLGRNVSAAFSEALRGASQDLAQAVNTVMKRVLAGS